MKITFEEKEIQKMLELYANDNFCQPIFKLMKVNTAVLTLDWEKKRAELKVEEIKDNK